MAAETFNLGYEQHDTGAPRPPVLLVLSTILVVAWLLAAVVWSLWVNATFDGSNHGPAIQYDGDIAGMLACLLIVVSLILIPAIGASLVAREAAGTWMLTITGGVAFVILGSLVAAHHGTQNSLRPPGFRFQPYPVWPLVHLAVYGSILVPLLLMTVSSAFYALRLQRHRRAVSTVMSA